MFYVDFLAYICGILIARPFKFGARGREFESRHSDQSRKGFLAIKLGTLFLLRQISLNKGVTFGVTVKRMQAEYSRFCDGAKAPNGWVRSG